MNSKKFRYLYFFIIVVLYVGIGTLLLIKYWQKVPYLAVFGLLVIAYGLFRGYRYFKETGTDGKNQDNEYRDGPTLLIALLLFAGCRGGEKQKETPDSVLAGSITIVADEDLFPMVSTQITVFQGIYLQAALTCEYLPEKEAISSLLEEKVRLGIVSRPLNQQELDYLETKKIYGKSIPLGYDAIAVVVHPENPVNKLSIQQVSDILSGKITEWSAVREGAKGSIRLVFDTETSGVIRFLNDTLGLGNKIAGDIVFAGSGTNQAAVVADDPNAVGFLGYALISEKENPFVQDMLRKLKVIALSAADPTIGILPANESLYNMTYPLIRKIYAVNTDPRAGLTTGFISHLASERGQKILYRLGLKPQHDFQRLVKIKEGL